MKNKIRLFAVFALLLISTASFAFAKSDFSISPFFSATSSSKQPVEFKKATVEKIDRMFWKISGTDKKGRPSSVYLLGTIHVGDEKLLPLPDPIMDAFWGAKRVAAEISEDDMENVEGAIAAAMGKSYLNANGRNVLDYLTEEEKKALEPLADKAMLEQLAVFEPWVMMIATSTGQYSQVGMTGEGGIDLYLMGLLSEKGKAWEGMDTLQTQLDILAFGDYDQQIFMLKQSIAAMINPKESSITMSDLYKAYLDDDVGTLSKLLDAELKNDEDVPPEMEDFMESYYKAIMDDRNSAWAKKIDSWLREGGSSFVFAGCAHFIGDHSVFYYLKENNTIE